MQRRTFLASLGALGAAGALPARAGAPVALGDDVFLENAWRELKGRRVGVITNQSGVTSRGISLVDAIRANGAIDLRAIYAPEHGFRGDRSAGAYVASSVDPQTGLPVYSLYGPTRHPSAEMLSEVDVLLFDIQDVGSRAYTFISTMAYAMQSAAAFNKAFWVLDRPNPVGGSMVEGPVLEPQDESFIGLYPIAMRHGMTVGELAKMFNDRFGIDAELHVVPMRGYTREMIWPDTGLRWIRTSPNIPYWQTCFPYLSTGLIDNANVNNGVGTANPFFYAGGYELDGSALARLLNARGLPGISFRAATWSPATGFWEGKTLSGVELVVEPRTFQAVRTSVEILCAVRTIAPRQIEVRKPLALDYDWGTPALRDQLLAGAPPETIVASWSAATEGFRRDREPYLLY
jgi:uncharacterized protein YbbC (DUF1343 family)